MPKYLFQVCYAEDGLKGLLKDGGTARRKAVEQAIKGLGGTLESFYFAFGDTDGLAIVDMPDNASSATFALVGSATGAFKIKTTVLMTPEEVDQAAKKRFDYRAPGQ